MQKWEDILNFLFIIHSFGKLRDLWTSFVSLWVSLFQKVYLIIIEEILQPFIFMLGRAQSRWSLFQLIPKRSNLKLLIYKEKIH